jgi:hypothetical protein
MAGLETIFRASSKDLLRETASGNDESIVLVAPTSGGSLMGVSLNKYINAVNRRVPGYVFAFRIPLGITLTTGIDVVVYVGDDGASSFDLGKKVYVGLTFKRLSANENLSIDSGAGAEQLVSITLSSTAGGLAIGSLSVLNAALDGAVVGDLVLCRVRRRGTDVTNDTAGGRALLYGLAAVNTAY